MVIGIATGQIKWHAQNTLNDAWDFDGANVFVTYKKNARIFAHKAHRNGFFYVPANEWGIEIWHEPVAYKKGAAYLGAGCTVKTIARNRGLYFCQSRVEVTMQVMVRSVTTRSARSM